MNSNTIAFKAISSFVLDLSSVFGETNHSLKLYERLLCKTTVNHEKIINKHVELFKEFCTLNRDGIISKSQKKFVTFKIEYSPKVYIDFVNIFENADSDSSKVIWNHLLTISALLDPQGNAKEILKNNCKDNDLLSNIFSKVEEHVKPNSNPMEAVSAIMSSGLITDLMSSLNNGMQDGTLDLSKLMGSVQKMCADINPDGGSSTQGGNPLEMMSGLLNQSGGGDGKAPDLSGLIGMVGPLLSTLAANKQQ
jgi:hypothetical protein